ncbi:redoxin domain-containing protein [Flavobacteriaceae bacterium R38]|nr:redoxin domain-containing protein [Flavobacteriaceae bacterium R38]
MTNYIKSLFISVFPVLCLFILINEILFIVSNPLPLGNYGRLLSASVVVVFFAGLFLKPVPRTQRNLNVHSVLIATGFLLSIAGDILGGNYLVKEILFSFLLITGWILYIKWFSVFKNRDKANIIPGRLLPEFQLEDINKVTITTSAFKGKSAIYLFYRGNWCPLCMAQIKEVSEQYKELEKREAQVILISPQPHKFTRSLAKKHAVNFHFMVDTENKAAKQLGISSKNGIPAGFQALGYNSDTVMPTVIITDKNGKIIFADLTDNYRVRPEPATFLKILDDAQ